MRRKALILCALAGLCSDSCGCGGSIVCGPSNCSGCCVFATGPGSSPRGTCVGFDFQSDSSCGGGGNACTACPQGFVCASGACSSNQCSAQTCAGCCSFASGAPLGTCIGVNSESATTCGLGGAVCVPCPAGDVCSNGTCVFVDLDAGGPSDAGVGVGDGG